eukprot:SAG31_NODE_32601_length_353_cov_1.618110_1_plen_57_part_10
MSRFGSTCTQLQKQAPIRAAPCPSAFALGGLAVWVRPPDAVRAYIRCRLLVCKTKFS